MPRVSREQADKNRLAVEAAASRLFREHGIDGVTVADLMAAAGLTHGGFYGHFDSKDALAVVACERAFDESVRRWDGLTARQPGSSARAAMHENYLNAAHRDHPGKGCPAAALAADVARQDEDSPVRQAYVAGVKQLVATLAGMQDETGAPARRAAMAQLATMVGALTLARATQGDALSGQFLSAAREFLARADGAQPPAAAGKRTAPR